MGSDVRQFSKNIAGRAMVCTSVLSVVPREMAFGSCNIGASIRPCTLSCCGIFAGGGREGGVCVGGGGMLRRLNPSAPKSWGDNLSAALSCGGPDLRGT